MGMFTGLLDDFKTMFRPSAAVEQTILAELLPEPEPVRVVRFAHDEDDMDTDHMAKVVISKDGTTTVETGTMTYEEVAAAASEFRRIANKLAHEASVMKKRAYREAKKWERE